MTFRPDPGWAWFLDLDGTLIEIAETPDGIRPPSELSELLHEWHRATGGALALISGRPLAELDALFPELGLPAAGQHGLERRDSTGRIFREGAATHRLDGARRRLREAANRHPGLRVEDKGLSLALHYRQVPHLASYAHRVVRAAQAELGGDFQVQGGKRVVEMKPAGRDKGTAVTQFMAEPPFQGRLPIFVGDDLTDEHGFAVVAQLGGRAVKVGPGRTRAHWRLPSADAVRRWLLDGSPGPRSTGHAASRAER
ncbi:MAG: trehalose-phosphatase [Gemmatimonadota bacterium]